MPYKDLEKRKEFHREYSRQYMREHTEYRITSEKNRAEKMVYWKENGIINYKFRRLSKKYGINGIKVFLRDNCSCVRCGEVDFRVLVLDHILPKSKGGTDDPSNLQTLCNNCHSIKHFMEDVEIGNEGTAWDEYWMGFAKYLGRYATCLSRKIGGVLVKNNAIVSIGWNGPLDVIGSCSLRNPNKEEVCPRKLIGAKSGERLDLCPALHTEAACITNAIRANKSVDGAILYIDCSIPCKDCMVAIINSGIEEVVCNLKGSNTSNFSKFYDEVSEFIYKESDLNIRFVEI